jgi:hypothetical protein
MTATGTHFCARYNGCKIGAEVELHFAVLLRRSEMEIQQKKQLVEGQDVERKRLVYGQRSWYKRTRLQRRAKWVGDDGRADRKRKAKKRNNLLDKETSVCQWRAQDLRE